MAKNEAEWSSSFSIFWLKKHGYLPQEEGLSSGGIKWTYGLSGNESSINFTVVINREGNWDGNSHIRLRYTHTNKWTGEKADVDYEVELATTPCNYGGVRYWFICPLTRDGQYCGRRVGVLYSVGKYFGCRYCGNIAYSAQMKGGKFRGTTVSIPDIERLEKEIKRYYYNGKPTRKYRRLIRMNLKLKMDLVRFAARFDKKFERFATPPK